MNRSETARLVCAVAIVVVGILGLVRPSMAAGSPDFVIDFPAGLVCSFALHVEGSGGPQVNKTFTDRNGNVRVLSAGTGSALTFTNSATGKNLSLNSNGAVSNAVLYPDGSATVVLTGHNVLFLFPTDMPPGPSTTLYVGRVVFTIDAFGNYAVKETSGTSTDICAALSG